MTPGSLAKQPHFHGPKLAAWLEDRGVRAYQLDDNRRVMGLWKQGRRVRLSTADAYLCALGFHFSELPEDIYVEDVA